MNIMMKCGGCGKFIATQEGIRCQKCPGIFHRACLNIPEKVRMSPEWICPACKADVPRDNNPSTPVRGTTTQYMEDKEVSEQLLRNSSLLQECKTVSLDKNIIQQLLLVIEGLKTDILLSNTNQRVLSEEISQLRTDLQNYSVRLISFENLEKEVKSLRTELQVLNSKKEDIPLKSDLQTGVGVELLHVNSQPSIIADKQKIKSMDKSQKRPESFRHAVTSKPPIKMTDLLLPTNTQESYVVKSVSPVSESEVLPTQLTITSNAEDWQIVDRRRRRVAIRGAGEVDEELQAVEALKRIHLWSLKADTSVDTVVGYMARKNHSGQTHYAVEKLLLKHNNYASFVITVPESLFSFFMAAENWPANARINEWFRWKTSPKGPAVPRRTSEDNTLSSAKQK